MARRCAIAYGNAKQPRSLEEDYLLREGAAALNQGRAADARARFQELAAAGSANPLVWLLLAIACRHTRDPAAEETALDRLLVLDPQSIRGLIMKGDCRVHAGDQATALGLYRAAIAISENGQVPADTVGEVQRARAALTELEDRAHAKREALMTAHGLPPDDWSPRFRHALDVAAGRRKTYVQQPTVFNYPELPNVQYYDTAGFDWVSAIEGPTAVIRSELVALLGSDGIEDFRPYIQARDANVRLDANKSLVENQDWSALFLCENGTLTKRLVERCPKTWEAVQQAPLARIAGWSPTVMFSLLKAGARIAAHTGMFNTRLVCHLPLIVPPNCRFRVGNEIREWQEGKLFIFNDTIEHEAWNDSDEDRVVLIFDIWRPELSDREKAELTALFRNA